MRTEEEVDVMIKDMISRTTSKYIFQSVAFNKNNPKQMLLLKKALMYSNSFSGLCKEFIESKFGNLPQQTQSNILQIQPQPVYEEVVRQVDFNKPKTTIGKSAFLVR